MTSEPTVDQRPMPTDAFAWGLALFPVPYFVVVALWSLASEGVASADQDAAQSAINLIALVAVLGLTHMDHRALRETGRWSMWGWIFLSPLAYLISRNIRLGGSPGPMLVAIATYGVWLTLILLAAVAM